MPLMRIRSVEIVFEDDMSCADTAILDRSLELLLSDSDDSTKCVDDLQPGEKDENDYSVTLNVEADLSDDTISSKENIVSDHQLETPSIHQDNGKPIQANDDTSLNVSELGDSGRFTDASSHEAAVKYSDALLSHSFDAINIDESSLSTFELSEVCTENGKTKLLLEYIDSDSSDSTAVCDENAEVKILTSKSDMVTDELDSADDSYDIQYDSFVDMGKF